MLHLGTGKEAKKDRQRLLHIAASSAVGGAMVGGGGALLGGVRGLKGIGKAALTGGALAAILGTGANAIGDEMLEESNDPSIDTRRGAVGGAVGGTALGGLAGGAIGAASGKLGKMGALRALLAELPSNNLIGDRLRAIAASKAQPAIRALQGAAVGAPTLGILGSFVGADEGQQYDAIRNIAKEMT